MFGKLKVVCTHAPKNPPGGMRVIKDSIDLITFILNKFGYGDEWKIRFIKLRNGSSNDRFRVIRKEGIAIRLFTKTGDNATCWESLLTPAKGYLINEVFGNLQQVHPIRIFYESTPKETTTSISISKSEHKEIVKKQQAKKEQENIDNKKNDGSKNIIKNAPVVAAAPVAQKPPVQKETKTLKEITNILYHKLTPDPKLPLIDSPKLEDNALICLELSVDKNYSIAAKGIATVFAKFMDFDYYIKNNNHYNVPHKIASAILKILVKNGYLITDPITTKDKNGKSIRDEKGEYLRIDKYIFTEKAKVRLKDLESYKEKLLESDVPIAESEKTELISDDDNNKIIEQIERNSKELQRIMDICDGIQTNIKDCEDIINEKVVILKEHEQEIIVINSQIDELNKKLQIFNERLNEENIICSDIKQEINEFDNIKKDEEASLENFKQKARQLLTT